MAVETEKVDGSKDIRKVRPKVWIIPYARVREGEELRETGAIC